MYRQFLFIAIVASAAVCVNAQNPLVMTQYSADPSARVFGNRIYVYPSHDILASEGRGRKGWFCMEDYHVFSSEDLSTWKDHGVILNQTNVPWAKPNAYSMWAPDCIERNGKFYFYFPATAKDTLAYGKGFTVGVAVADSPIGPFVPKAIPIAGIRGIDPNVFIDRDGQAYIYWSQGNIYGAKLKDNMLELASEPVVLKELPVKGLKEGPYLFERKGTYYFSFPHVENKIERLEYATGNNPLGPFTMAGVIMDESPSNCWTNHHSVVQFKDQWYLFYHHNDLSPQFDKARSIRADSLFFNPDGTVRKVVPTLRGIGLTSASNKIQIDRFTQTDVSGAGIEFIDTTDRFKGWAAVFAKAGAWMQYNSVDFGKAPLKTMVVKARAAGGGIIQVRSNSIKGPVIAEVKIPASGEWKTLITRAKTGTGIQHLFVLALDGRKVEIDWISFE